LPTDDELFDHVGRRLQQRPAWRYEPSTTPGVQPSWCLVRQGEILLGVTVIDGVHSVTVPEDDTVIDFADSDGLMAWIEAHEEQFLRPSSG